VLPTFPYPSGRRRHPFLGDEPASNGPLPDDVLDLLWCFSIVCGSDVPVFKRLLHSGNRLIILVNFWPSTFEEVL